MAKCIRLKEPDSFGDVCIVRRPNLVSDIMVEAGGAVHTTKGAWRAYEKRLHQNMRRTSMLIKMQTKKAKKAERLRQRGGLGGVLSKLRGH